MTETKSGFVLVNSRSSRAKTSPAPLVGNATAGVTEPPTKSEVKSETKVSLGNRGTISGRNRTARSAKSKMARSKQSTKANLPPAIHTSMVVPFHAMYNASGTTLTGVTVADIFGALGGMCTVANSTHTSWATSFRIKRITIWPGAGNAGANSQIADIFWTASIGGAGGASGWAKDDEVIQALPSGATQTSAAVFAPPKASMASQWINSSATGTVFDISCPTGSVIEFEATFTLTNFFIPTTNTIAAGTLGAAYFLALDGPSTHRYTPLGIPTTN